MTRVDAVCDVAVSSRISGNLPGRPVFKRTCDLSVDERMQFVRLFAEVFGKVMDPAQFERKYLQTPLGYSHHGLLVQEDRLVGAYNLLPQAYRFFGQRQVFGLSVDTMIAQGHRGGPFSLLRMAQSAYEGALRDGIGFVFGFPNDKAYLFTRRVLQWRDMGELDFYALPVRIGSLRPRLRWANALYRVLATGLVRLPAIAGAGRSGFPIERTQEGPLETEAPGHCRIDLRQGEYCVYSTCIEEGQIRTTYLIDVCPLTAACFARAVRAVYDAVAGDVDLILYVGRLAFRPVALLKVPQALRPRPIRMCGKILVSGQPDERVLDMSHWKVSLRDFDVR